MTDDMPPWDNERNNGLSETPTKTSVWESSIPLAVIKDGEVEAMCPATIVFPPEVGEEKNCTAWTVMTTFPARTVRLDYPGPDDKDAQFPETWLCGGFSPDGDLCLKLTTQKPTESEEQEIYLSGVGNDTEEDGEHVLPCITIGAENERLERSATAQLIFYVRLGDWHQYLVYMDLVDGVLYAWTDERHEANENIIDTFIREAPNPLGLPEEEPTAIKYDLDGPEDETAETLDRIPLAAWGDDEGTVRPRFHLRLASGWVGDYLLEGGSQIMTGRSIEKDGETTREQYINESLPWVKCCELDMPWCTVHWKTKMKLEIWGVYHNGTYCFRYVEKEVK